MNVTPSPIRYAIGDDLHAEAIGTPFESLQDAVAELRRLAELPWDSEPNRAPCGDWKTCGRDYWLREFDSSRTPWLLGRAVFALSVSADGPFWRTQPDEIEARFLDPR